MGSQPYNHYDTRWQPGPSPGDPYASHDTGPYFPAPAYPLPAPPNRPPAGGGFTLATSKALPVSDYRIKQTVSARITTDTWVMGVIIGVAHICAKLTGRTYMVEFESIDGSGRRERRQFSNEELMPYRPGG